MNLDSEAYWMQRIAELDAKVSDLKADKVDLIGEVHRWRSLVDTKNAIIHDLEDKIIALQKKVFHANEY